MRILVLLLVFCFSAFVTFAQTRYENERYRFSIISPDGFEVIRDYQPMIPVVFLSAPEDANDLFRENINVAVEPLPAPLNNTSTSTSKTWTKAWMVLS